MSAVARITDDKRGDLAGSGRRHRERRDKIGGNRRFDPDHREIGGHDLWRRTRAGIEYGGLRDAGAPAMGDRLSFRPPRNKMHRIRVQPAPGDRVVKAMGGCDDEIGRDQRPGAKAAVPLIDASNCAPYGFIRAHRPAFIGKRAQRHAGDRRDGDDGRSEWSQY